MGGPKKYTLFSASGGAKPPCAFFASPDGCRNGDKCKFAHVLSGEQHQKQQGKGLGGEDYSRNNDIPSSKKNIVSASSAEREHNSPGSVVSSESSGNEMEPSSSPPPQPPAVVVAPTAVKNEITKKGDKKPDSNDGTTSSTSKKKNRRGKRKTGDDSPFANPSTTRSIKKVKVSPKLETATPNASKQGTSSKKKNKSAVEEAAVQTQPTAIPPVVDFRSLNLPVAPFTIPGTESAPAKSPGTPKDSTPSRAASTLPLPNSSASGRKWLLAVQNTQKNHRFRELYNFEKLKDLESKAGLENNIWVKSKPFGAWSEKLPQVIAIDCEMCETQDPESKARNARALCRISVVDATTDDVLLDTLVKPAWPVIEHRTWINGIAAEHLEDVQFTIQHAQAFMMALCSEETVIVGHAVNNDLAAMRMEHYCVADSACLFSALDSPTATVGLKDLAASVLKKAMPSKHDSVNDARAALSCVKFYLEKEGKVEGIERSASSRPNCASQLFIHRIPAKCNEEHICKMFLQHTSVEPAEVDSIELLNGIGKTLVHFRSSRHANLAFDTLESKAELESSGRLQKKVFLRDGGYIRVRKMAYEKGKTKPGSSSGSGAGGDSQESS